MKSLLFILLAGYAVRSDENNYYVIEMQDVPPTSTNHREGRKPFKVYWNVPTMQCASKKIHFDNLYEKYGIIQNDKDRFKGEKVTILYDPGLFPALFKNESGGKIRFRNGGVPQEGDLNKHLDEFKKELDRSIPDRQFSGVGIIDFESWRPTFRQNFGVLQPYKDVSIEIERKLHWWWKKQWIEEEAKRRFEEAARTFMEGTLTVAKALRPQARWGFYGFPYCFNMASNNMVETCASNVPQENDKISWLWSGSTALYPSVYSSVHLSTSQLVSLIRGRVKEAGRCSQNDGDILPYFWFRYRDGGFLTETDLSMALSTLFKSRATGILIWGSSNDVNTVEKCNKLLDYVQTTLGPAIAKYTVPVMKDSEDNEANFTLTIDTVSENSLDLRPNVDLILDPEFHWMPPANYTEDLKNDVEEQINKKFNQNKTNAYDNTVLQNNSVLIDLILNVVLNKEENLSTTSIEILDTKYDKKTQQENEFSDMSTEPNFEKSTDTSQITNNIVTKNPLLSETKTVNESQNIEINFRKSLNFNQTTTEKAKPQTETIAETTSVLQSVSVLDATTTAKTNIDETIDEDNDTKLDMEEDNLFNIETFVIFYNDTKLDRETTEITNTDFTKSEKKDQSTTWNLSSKHLETTTENNSDIIMDDKFDILETPTSELVDTDLFTEGYQKIFTENNEFTSELSILNTTTDIATKQSINFTEDQSFIKTTTEESEDFFQSNTYKPEENKSNSDNNVSKNPTFTSASTNLQDFDKTDSPIAITDIEFTTEGSDISKTIETEVRESSSTAAVTEQVVVF